MLTTPRKKPVAICTADTPQAHACTCALNRGCLPYQSDRKSAGKASAKTNQVKQ